MTELHAKVIKAREAYQNAVNRGDLRYYRNGKPYYYTNIADIRRIEDRIRRLKVKYDKLLAEYLGKPYIPDYDGQDN